MGNWYKGYLSRKAIKENYHISDSIIERFMPEPEKYGRYYNTTYPLWREETVSAALSCPAAIIAIGQLEQKRSKYKKNAERKARQEDAARAYLRQFDVASMLAYAKTLTRRFIIHCGPTNSGKTYQALHALTSSSTACYLGPLRLLALEVFDTLNGDGIPCSLLTGEERIDVPYAGVTASTIEMADFHAHYDVAIIDEAQLIADRARGGHWLSTILRINASAVHVCVAPEGLNLVRSLIEHTGSPFEVVNHERLAPLTFAGHYDNGWKCAQRGDAFIAFSRRSVLTIAAELEHNGHKASVIYGALPPQSRREEVRRFIEGETEVVVATDAIGMGVSLPIRRVVFCETEKFDGVCRRPLNSTEVKQIAGRAGRYGIHDEGFVLTITDTKSMRKRLNAEPKPFAWAVIPFPRDALQSEYPLDVLIALWNKMTPIEGFSYEDLTEAADLLGCLLRSLGKKQVRELSKTGVFQLVSCPLDTKNEDLCAYWLRCAIALLREDEMPAPEVDTDTLEAAETSYRMLDVAAQMARRAGIEYDVSEQKQAVETAINKFLKGEKARRSCKYCGKPIPVLGPYTMCDACYHKRFGYHNDWDDDDWF